jgi:hypothetical protein
MPVSLVHALYNVCVESHPPDVSGSFCVHVLQAGLDSKHNSFPKHRRHMWATLDHWSWVHAAGNRIKSPSPSAGCVGMEGDLTRPLVRCMLCGIHARDPDAVSKEHCKKYKSLLLAVSLSSTGCGKVGQCRNAYAARAI